MFSPKKLHKEHSDKETLVARHETSAMSPTDPCSNLLIGKPRFRNQINHSNWASYATTPTIDQPVCVSRKVGFGAEITASDLILLLARTVRTG